MIVTETIEYYLDNMCFIGFLAYNSQSTTKQPCIMIAHDWGGRSVNFCNKAIELARYGYVGFAIDMYGNARTAGTTLEKKALLNPLIAQRMTVQKRILAAFEQVRSLPQVDVQQIAAIGYCFGGLCVLDLARAGAVVRGVVSFHGLLTAPDLPNKKSCTAKILVLHGYDDPLVPPQQLKTFASEMSARQADWQIHIYGNTAHSFTNPEAHDPELGLHYNRLADERSWKTTEGFLKELFIPI